MGPFVAFCDLAPKPVGKKSCFEATDENVVPFSVKFLHFIRLMHALAPPSPAPGFLIGP